MFGFGFGNVRWSGLRGQFNPLMTSPVLYLNADSGVIHSNDKVSQWTNLGSGTQNAVQAVGAAQPIFNASGFDGTGRAYIDTNGSSHFLDLGTEYSKLPEHTVITVWMADVVNVNQAILADQASTSGAQNRSAFHVMRTPNQELEISYGDGANFRTYRKTNLFQVNTPYILLDTKTEDVAEPVVELNGIAQNPLTNFLNGTATNIGGTAFKMSISKLGDFNAFYFNGKIAAIYIADRVVSTEEKTLLTNYFKTYYGIS
jgi:hypothetical protein